MTEDEKRLNESKERAALDLYLTFEKSGADHFTVQLYRLIAKADGSKRRRIELGFPLQVAMYAEWMITPDRHTFYEKYNCVANYKPPDFQHTQGRLPDDEN